MLEALAQEIALVAAPVSVSAVGGQPKVQTLYLGGGTPSLLTTEELHRLLDQLEQRFDFSALQEFTIEANPDDLDAAYVSALRSLRARGLNRFSVGVQSFFDEDLAYMRRAHSGTEARDALKRLQDAGFEKITIDLIYGTPTMNDQRWLKNLEIFLDYQLPHLSAYALTVEPKTTLAKRIREGDLPRVDDEQAGRQFRLLQQVLREAGYDQYEISNFARPGHYAVHNTNYWRGVPYIGLGPSAHAYNGHQRSWNVRNNNNYIAALREGRRSFEFEILTAANRANERIMTALRTMWGLWLGDADVVAYRKNILDALKAVPASYYIMKDETILLTDEGKFFADGIAASLFITD